MTDTDVINFIRPEPPRDNYGRYLIKPPGGGKSKAYTRATTIAETLDDRYNLELYKIRMAMKGMALDKGIYAQAASLPLPVRGDGNWERWKKLGQKSIDRAKEHDAAALGEALHRFTERINQGDDVHVPAPWDADIAVYLKTLTDHGLTVDRRHLERIVVHHDLGVAGTFDAILNGYIADLKTGATLDFSWCAIAMQLAIYAHADTLYDVTTETHEAMPAVDQETALVIHLPAGQAYCTLYKVNIVDGWEAVQHALWTRQWRNRKNLASPYQIVGGGAGPERQPVPPSKPPADEQHEGGTVHESTAVDRPNPALDKLRARYRRLPEPKQAWVLNLMPSFGTDRYQLGLALVRFAELDVDDDLLRAAVKKVIDWKPTIRQNLKTILAVITDDQAEALSAIAVAIHNGEYSIVYRDDGVHIDAA